MTDPITHENTLAEIDDLKARIASVERERDECDALRERMADLLTRTTNALKGEPAELELHSWHDLPDVAVAIRSRIASVERERDDALKWKAAVQDAAVVSWTLSPENENDPIKAVNDLLCWTQRVALDPAVSAEAKSWRDRNAALVKAVEGLVASANDMRRYGSMTQVAAWDRLDAALAAAEAAVDNTKGPSND